MKFTSYAMRSLYITITLPFLILGFLIGIACDSAARGLDLYMDLIYWVERDTE